MKPASMLLSILFFIQFQVKAQEFKVSEEFRLTQYDTELFDKMTTPGQGFDGHTDIYIIDKKETKLRKISVYIESYNNEAKVEEWETPGFNGIRKIIRVIINQCISYCDTTKYYWLITDQNELIDLPVIQQEDFEYESKTLDYAFETKSGSIDLVEFQHEMISNKEDVEPIFQLRSKSVLKKYFWDGASIHKY